MQEGAEKTEHSKKLTEKETTQKKSWHVGLHFEATSVDKKRIFFMLLGVGLFFGVYLSPPWPDAIDPQGTPFELNREGKAAIGLFLLAATWWVFEVVPIGVTGILIGVTQSLFLIRESKIAFSDFLDPSVWFIIGSVVIGMTFSKTGLTKRMAYNMLLVVGERTSMIYLGVYLMTSALTLIMAHTAVAAAVYPLFFGIPFWLVVVWGLAFMLSRRIRDTAFSLSHIKTHYFHHPNLIKFEKILVFDVVIYLLLILSLISFWQSNIPLFLLLLIVLAFTLSAYHMKEDVFFVVFTMVIGPTIEVICVYFGAWSYGNPSLLGIPIWLPLAYGIFGVLVRRTAITTVNYFWSS